MRDYRGGTICYYKIECQMLENNPTGLERAEIECVVRNQYNRLFRQQHDLNALSASKGTSRPGEELETLQPIWG